MNALRETLSGRSPLFGKQLNRGRRQLIAQSVYGEEVLIVDARAHLTPAQMVERKLIGLMKTVPVSCVHSASVLRSR